MHRDGYGFLIPDQAIEGVRGDIFIPPDSAQQAMHGDRVVVRIAQLGPDGRAEGEILEVVRRAHPTIVGEFRIGRRGHFVIPHDQRIPQRIDIPEGMEIPRRSGGGDRAGVRPVEISDVADLDGMIVNVEALDTPRVTGMPLGAWLKSSATRTISG